MSCKQYGKLISEGGEARWVKVCCFCGAELPYPLPTMFRVFYACDKCAEKRLKAGKEG